MKIRFGKIFWPSFIAALIVSILGLVLFFLTVGGLISSISDNEPNKIELKDKTVLHLTLDQKVGERTRTEFSKTSFEFNSSVGLSELLYGFKVASSDDKIAGIFVDLKGAKFGYTTAKEIRDAINEFEKSGKFVIAYNSGEVISQKSYYVASAANTNYAFPTSSFEMIGLGVELMYFKNTLDKLGVEMQVIRGKNNDFKSAVEPFFRSNMSDSSRLQIERYLTSMWNDIKSAISKDRKIEKELIETLANKASIRRAEEAKQYKLIDDALYRDQVIDQIKKKLNVSKDDPINFYAFEKYAKKKFRKDQFIQEVDSPEIAVILAEGEISKNGEGLTSTDICKLFQDVRKNKSVKAVVFRINSPGGSALASDEIWREVVLTQKEKKVIVSMGDVAASGGYYIAAPADRIFAESTTITGSIGVFGVIPFTGKMLNDKLGLTFDRATTNNHSVLSLNKKLTTEEMSIIQEEVDKIYDDFLSRVASGRKMSKEQVNRLARGRVWTGQDALKNGLVDEIGGIKSAIKYAQEITKSDADKILYYPTYEEEPFEMILEKLKEDDMIKGAEVTLSQELIDFYAKLKKLEKFNGMQMRLPYELIIN
ncbi:MAG: signal peptide peptidase SppA [Crocinitomicaceae bacterium]